MNYLLMLDKHQLKYVLVQTISGVMKDNILKRNIQDLLIIV